MSTREAINKAARSLPSVDELLRSASGIEMIDEIGQTHSATLARAAIDAMRTAIIEHETISKEEMLARCEARLLDLRTLEKMRSIKKVINATGVVVHTNLGRAPLSDDARHALMDAAGYCSLEYDLETGKRGRRGGHIEDMLIELTGAEDAIVVNNCAAAAFFILTAFAAGGEAVISRGELVEIGGDFRVPDVLAMSGSTLREVGTTNRTKLADYEKAIGETTRMLLRVHPSNYRIVGFTSTPSTQELSSLAHKHDLIFYEDIGSGAMIDLSSLGLTDEPLAKDSISQGADIVSFSGDKLLGGPQSGIIAGRKDLVDRLRKHPLYRALRPDKLTLAVLGATLRSYVREKAVEEIPVLRQIAATADEIGARAAKLITQLRAKPELKVETVTGESVIGGGAAPDVRRATKLIVISHQTRTAESIERQFRMFDPPIIARIEDGRVLIDLRCVGEKDEKSIVDAIDSVSA